MSHKNQPGLFLSIYCCKTMLNELVLCCSFSPIMFTVSYAEVKHAIIRRVPTCLEFHFYISNMKNTLQRILRITFDILLYIPHSYSLYNIRSKTFLCHESFYENLSHLCNIKHIHVKVNYI